MHLVQPYRSKLSHSTHILLLVDKLSTLVWAFLKVLLKLAVAVPQNHQVLVQGIYLMLLRFHRLHNMLRGFDKPGLVLPSRVVTAPRSSGMPCLLELKEQRRCSEMRILDVDCTTHFTVLSGRCTYH